jgi:hypothetical protein
MTEPPIEDLEARMQAYLNCLELCRALHRQTDDHHVKEALAPVIDDLQTSLATLASHLRQWGAAPGTFRLDRQGKARIREMLGMRSLSEQMFAIRDCLADLVAWYAEHPPADQTDPTIRDWLVPLSTHTQHVLEWWDQQMREMKAI